MVAPIRVCDSYRVFENISMYLVVKMVEYWSDKSGGSAMVDYALVIIVLFFMLFCKPGGCSEMCLASEGIGL